MQLALRDKEELLVEKALERIRRAQMLGKTNVKLTQPELDALERKRRKDEAKRKTSASNLKNNDRRRSSGQSTSVPKEQKSIRRKSKGLFSAYDAENSSGSRRATPPGMLVPGPKGVPVYSPLGFYPPPAAPKGSSPRTGSRSTSSHSLAQVMPSPSRNQQQRHPSGSEQHKPRSAPRSPAMSSRSLPDDPNWIPRTRSSSTASTQPYPQDPYQYQAYSPALPHVPSRYSQGRRIVSSPQPDLQYPSVRGELSTQSSDPSFLRREHSGQATPGISDSDDHLGSDDDDEDDGVQVNVAAYDQGYGINVRGENYVRERPRRGRR